MDAMPAFSAPTLLNETYATLVTRNDASYVLAAAVLGASIRASDSSRAMVAIVLPSVHHAKRQELIKAGWTIAQRSPIPEFWWSDCEDTTSAGQKKRWGAMMSKLWLWTLPYARVHYLDADSMLLRPARHTTESFAAEPGRHDGLFNAGIMSLVPNRTTFDRLLAIGYREKPPRLFGNIIDCTEQGLLNVAFRNASRMDVVRADDRVATRSSTGVAVHWITHTCPKPWMSGIKLPSFCDARAYAIWTRYRHRLRARLATGDESRGSATRRRGALIDWLMLSVFVSLVVGLLWMRVIRRCRPERNGVKAR
jgi:glycogenin glucosyltransferase